LDNSYQAVSTRLVKAISPPEIVRSYSNFSFREERFPDNQPISRILSQARCLGCKSMFVERIPISGFVLADNGELKKAGKGFLRSEAYRINFFSRILKKPGDVRGIKQKHYLGYVVMKGNEYKNKPKQWIVFESIINSPRHDNNYAHASREYDVRAGKRIFKIVGSLYCQQNRVTNTCAHAALRTVISSITTAGDISYKEINDILRKKKVPFNHLKKDIGLSTKQIKIVLTAKKIRFYELKDGKKQRARRKKRGSIPYQKYLYGSIESGYPALFGFQFRQKSEKNPSHMIPILGHTFNDDMWVPTAESIYFTVNKNTKYVPSEKWVSTYICHDDNLGSNFCIPRSYVDEGLSMNPLKQTDDVYVLGTLPEKCKCDPIEAEAIAADCLYEMMSRIQIDQRTPWLHRLKIAVENSWVVLRPILLTGEEYVKHLEGLRGWKKPKERISENMLQLLRQYLDGIYWVVEISMPELFPANRRKLGEVVIYAHTYPSLQRNFRSFVFARLPGNFYFVKDVKKNEPDFWEIPSYIKTHSKLIELAKLQPTWSFHDSAAG